MALAINRASPLPFYYQLKQILLTELRKQELAPGDRLPGDHELCNTYNVSRTVVRQALSELETEGVIERVRHVGYAICDRHVDELHCSVAAPIYGQSGAVVAALSVAFTDRDVNPLTQVDLVRVTARRISLLLKSTGRPQDPFSTR